MVTVQLNVPVVHGDETITEVTLARPTVMHLRQAQLDSGPFDYDYYVLAEACAGLPRSVINQIDGYDFNAQLKPALVRFLLTPPKSGVTSSGN